MVKLQFDSRLLSKPLPERVPTKTKGDHLITLEAKAGRSINQTLKDLEIKLAQPVAALVNGKTTDLEQPLEPGDHVRLLPQIAGGD